MSLLDRYIHEVGRYLPRKNRGDIQAELKSSVVDTLEDRFGQNPSEEQVTELLKEFGRPRDVAASYFPQGQYLVGPTLYPLFRMVSWIVVAAVLGAQLLAFGVGILVTGEAFSPLGMLAALVNSVPASLGWVLITFMILQHFDAKPYLQEESWDPKQLPEVEIGEEIKPAENIISLVFSVLFLGLVTLAPQWIGFITTPGGKFYPNPVILDNLVLIQVALLANVLFDVYQLWRRQWVTATRLIKLGLEALSIFVLAVLVQGHNAWLAARSSGGLLGAVETLSNLTNASWELVGMEAYRMAFSVALVVTVIEMIVSIYKMVRSRLIGDASAKELMLKVE
jgi:hypothetical protein